MSLTPDELLDGLALWDEHKPQSGEDWAAVADRCLADETFDVSKSSPLFAGLILRSRDLAAWQAWAEQAREELSLYARNYAVIKTAMRIEALLAGFPGTQETNG